MRIADSDELRVKLDKNQQLLTASIELTRRCNLRCVHCLRNLDSVDLPYDVVCAALDQLVALGCMTLTLTGGEPFVRRDLLDIVRYAWGKRLAVRIMSNGTLLTGEAAAELKRLHASELQVSVYAADPSIHDAVTQVPGSHERTLQGIARAREQGLTVRVAMPLMTMNADQAPAVEALCKERGLTFVQGTLIFPKNDGDRRPLSLLPTSEQMAHVIKKESPGDCDRPVLLGPPGVAAPLCSAGRDRLGIGADGTIYPCDAWRIALGNVHSDRLAGIWFGSQRLSELRAARRWHPLGCAGCSAQGQCVWCPGLSFDLLGDAKLPNPQDCRRARLSYATPAYDEPGWSVPGVLKQC